jgi:bifunctional non-homologous end joining protein LigD
VPARVKTSGWAGVHVWTDAPPGATFAATKAFARDVARDLEGDDVTSAAQADRTRKVYVDWVQNDPSRSLAAPYSVRALDTPSVSTPLDWNEVADGRAGRYDMRAVLDRLDRFGDLSG